MEKTFRTRDGALSVKLVAPETPLPDGGCRSEPREYDWKRIVGALREAIRYLRENRQVLQSLNPASDRSSFLLASSVRHKLGHIRMTLYHSFRFDPRRDDGVGVEQEEISDTLHLCLQERRDLQFAAGNLWRVYRDIAESLQEPFGDRLDYEKLEKLEPAVDAVAKLTVDAEFTSVQPGHEEPAAPQTSAPAVYVKLSEMAIITGQTKSNMRALKRKRIIPEPDLRGRNGQADQWLWDTIRPILEMHSSRQIPKRYPGDLFAR